MNCDDLSPGFRCFFLDKICEKLGSQGDSVDVLVNNCKFDMRLRMADSAWKQVTGGLRLLGFPVRSPPLLGDVLVFTDDLGFK